MGSEGPQWWASNFAAPMSRESLKPTRRCSSQWSVRRGLSLKVDQTCPKIVETFGGAECSPSDDHFVVGTSAHKRHSAAEKRAQILPSKLDPRRRQRRDHENPADTGVGCPGNNWGGDVTGQSSARDRAGKPAADCVARLVDAQHPSAAKLVADLEERLWWTRLRDAMGFPGGVPGIPDSIFLTGELHFPLCSITTGVRVRSQRRVGQPGQTPRRPIRHVIAMKVPRVGCGRERVGRRATTQRGCAARHVSRAGTLPPVPALNSMGDPFTQARCAITSGHGAIFKTSAAPSAGDPPPVARRALRHARRLRRCQ